MIMRVSWAHLLCPRPLVYVMSIFEYRWNSKFWVVCIMLVKYILLIDWLFCCLWRDWEVRGESWYQKKKKKRRTLLFYSMTRKLPHVTALIAPIFTVSALVVTAYLFKWCNLSYVLFRTSFFCPQLITAPLDWYNIVISLLLVKIYQEGSGPFYKRKCQLLKPINTSFQIIYLILPCLEWLRLTMLYSYVVESYLGCNFLSCKILNRKKKEAVSLSLISRIEEKYIPCG